MNSDVGREDEYISPKKNVKKKAWNKREIYDWDDIFVYVYYDIFYISIIYPYGLLIIVQFLYVFLKTQVS